MSSFVDSLNQVGATFCGFSWAMLLQSSVMIVVLYAVDMLIRRKVWAVVRYGVWMLVLVKLVLPPTLSVPTGIGYWVSVPTPIPVIETVVVEKPEPILRALPAPTIKPMPRAVPLVPVVTSPLPARPVPLEMEAVMVQAPAPALIWQVWMLVAWCAGVLVILGVLVQRLWFVRCLMKKSQPADACWNELLCDCARQVGLRNPVQVRVSEALRSPAACGWGP